MQELISNAYENNRSLFEILEELKTQVNGIANSELKSELIQSVEKIEDGVLELSQKIIDAMNSDNDPQ